MSPQFWFAILLFTPLLGFLFNGFRFRSKNYLLAGSVATGAVFISFIAACVLTYQLVYGDEPTIHLFLAQWIEGGVSLIPWLFYIDHVTVIMMLVITGVGTLIHLFSIGYMSHDERPSKYFAYLNLFLFNMLILVTAANLPVMFVGWEGVGLCSYLLIGFWFTDSEKAAAGMKAFITNRIGDAGFLLGIFLIYQTFGEMGFEDINKILIGVLPETGWTEPRTLACLFLFIGAMGKSAQIPLYVWLPDAMAGPTPVSALIHAATMVTAGVYMIIRLHPLFLVAPNAMMVVAIIGATTALLAALIGLTQWDIKKILAYSTVSQLGYMFLAVGVGAFGPALFHLMTHAFFKALMFLGSGSVIHSLHEEQDVRKMGGLKKYMPITYWTFMMGWLAIIGIPPFAGFFSKDEILWNAYASPHGHPSLWLIGAVTAACTAFYMTRLMALVFWGKSRVDKDKHPHESPFVMTLPLIVLGVLSVTGGWLGIPHILGEMIPGHPGNFLFHWLEIPEMEMTAGHGAELGLMAVSVLLAVGGAGLAYFFYILRPELPKKFTDQISGLYRFISNKYFVDEFYFARIIHPLVHLSQGLWLHVDVNFIDKATYQISDWVKSLGSATRSMQNGNMQRYALYISIGVVGTLIFILMR
jgi:NADH-quinone oxidoreductase subunit L